MTTKAMKDLEGGDDDQTGEANNDAASRTAARIAELDANIVGPDDEFEDGAETVVTLDDGDKGPSRQQKKDDRWAEHQARTDAAEQKAARLEDQNRRLTDAVVSRQQRREDPPAANAHEEAMEQIFKEQKASYKEFEAIAQNATEEQIETYEKKARKLDRQKIRLEAKQMLNEEGYRRHDPNEQTTNMVQAQFADVVAEPKALRYAKAAHNMAVADGETDDWALMERSMEKARAKYGLGGQPRERTQAGRKRHAGQPARVASPGTRDGGEPNTIRMTEAHISMAVARWPTLSRKEAISKWANGPGKRLAASEAE